MAIARETSSYKLLLLQVLYFICRSFYPLHSLQKKKPKENSAISAVLHSLCHHRPFIAPCSQAPLLQSGCKILTENILLPEVIFTPLFFVPCPGRNDFLYKVKVKRLKDLWREIDLLKLDRAKHKYDLIFYKCQQLKLAKL